MAKILTQEEAGAGVRISSLVTPASMKKILSQKEIDALFHAAQGLPADAPAPKPMRQQIARFDIRQAGRINKTQLEAVSVLHETFARNLSHTLGASLRVALDINLVSVEQLTYLEFLQRLSEISYLAALNVQPVGAQSVVQIDPVLALPIIDLLLGGRGKPETEVRDITEIESEILESVVGMICRELQTAWRPLLELEFSFERRLQQAQILQLMPPSERTLSLIFEIRMPEASGMIHMVFPTVVSNALLRKITQQWSYQKRRSLTEPSSQLREHMMNCIFRVELVLPELSVPADELVGMQIGQVLALPYAIDQPALLLVGGRKMFTAYPVRCDNFRGGEIQQRLKISSLPGKDSA